MDDSAKPDLNYLCPHCGKKAVAGAHFCRTTGVPTADQPKKKRSGIGGWAVFFAAAVLVIGLWRFLGPASLVVAALVGAVFLAVTRPGPSSRGKTKK